MPFVSLTAEVWRMVLTIDGRHFVSSLTTLRDAQDHVDQLSETWLKGMPETASVRLWTFLDRKAVSAVQQSEGMPALERSQACLGLMDV